MIIALACLTSLYFIAALLILWWTVTVTRRQRNADFRWHRDRLLAEMTRELLLHESRMCEYLTRVR